MDLPVGSGPGAVDGAHHTCGCLFDQPLIASSAAASEISSGSLFAGPINCTPIGKPEDVNPAGTLIEGQPKRFQGQVTGHARIMARSVARPPSLSKSVHFGRRLCGRRREYDVGDVEDPSHATLRCGFTRAGLAKRVLR